MKYGKVGTAPCWENNVQYTYTYDASNNQTSDLRQDWNGSTWVNIWQYAYSYDGNSFNMTDTYKEWNDEGTKVIYGDSSYYYYHTVLGINDLMGKEKNIVIYPNPANNKITISNNKEIPEEAIVSIFEISGQKVLQEKFHNQKLIEIDVSRLTNGIYLVKIQSKEGMVVKKLVIQ